MALYLNETYRGRIHYPLSTIVELLPIHHDARVPHTVYLLAWRVWSETSLISNYSVSML